MRMGKTGLVVMGISPGQSSSNSYILVLAEANSKRKLPIVISPAEAQAIASQLESIPQAQPLIYDIYFETVKRFSIELLETNIIEFENGNMVSELVFFDGEKKVLVRARTGDAVAIALRFRCPIFAAENILEEAGIIIEEDDEAESIYEPLPDSLLSLDEEGLDFDNYTSEELEAMLSEAVKREDYEQAGLIRDELNLRKSS